MSRVVLALQLCPHCHMSSNKLTPVFASNGGGRLIKSCIITSLLTPFFPHHNLCLHGHRLRPAAAAGVALPAAPHHLLACVAPGSLLALPSR